MASEGCPAANELEYLRKIAALCAHYELGASVRYFKPRIKFVGAKHVSPVDCVLLIFGDAEEAEVAA